MVITREVTYVKDITNHIDKLRINVHEEIGKYNRGEEAAVRWSPIIRHARCSASYVCRQSPLVHFNRC
ncbi:hypothetical protein PMALA_047030 [Plasmodium malariae]|uniref:Uncharacterized protein n=1 Tax=Plasmodium malariae TaxID=5858 RepID=A0A1A8WVK8_PLAMA|nr:hypothetical protein PMALA_047030 [Plasmodium malariae]